MASASDVEPTRDTMQTKCGQRNRTATARLPINSKTNVSMHSTKHYTIFTKLSIAFSAASTAPPSSLHSTVHSGRRHAFTRVRSTRLMFRKTTTTTTVRPPLSAIASLSSIDVEVNAPFCGVDYHACLGRVREIYEPNTQAWHRTAIRDTCARATHTHAHNLLLEMQPKTTYTRAIMITTSACEIYVVYGYMLHRYTS